MNDCVNRQGLWSVPGDGVLARQGDLILLSAIDERGLVEKLLDSLVKTSEGGVTAAALPTRSRTWSRAMRPGAVAMRGNLDQRSSRSVRQAPGSRSS